MKQNCLFVLNKNRPLYVVFLSVTGVLSGEMRIVEGRFAEYEEDFSDLKSTKALQLEESLCGAVSGLFHFV